MAFDAFLKVSAFPGESTDSAHKDEIELLSFSYGMDQPVGSNTSATGSNSATRVNPHDVRITKFVDFASTKLAFFCCSGEHIPTVTITVCRAGGDKQTYLTITLTDAMVSSVNCGGTAGGDSIPTEEVAFSYGSINWAYVKLTKEGKPDGGLNNGWSLRENKTL
jgi:type VI secretion system secreted protein Hcp